MVIKVGIVGLSKTGSWAEGAHLQPLKSLQEYYALTALSTTRAESAAEGAKEFGVVGYYGSTTQIAQDSNVDLVVVSVRVAAHKAALLPVLQAGKDVFCEWPLALNLAEAEEIAKLAKERGVKTMVGLQGRQGLAAKKARELIMAGKIGKVLSTTLVANGMGWGAFIDSRNQYIVDASNGATMLTIPLSHALDTLNYVLGDFVSLSAHLATQRPDVTVVETGQSIEQTAPDQVLVQGVLQGGAVASIHYRGGTDHGKKGGTDGRWEIEGSEGIITLTAPGGHFQLLPVTLALNGEVLDLGDDKLGNVGREYEAFAKGDLAGYVDFDHAVERHRLLNAIEQSARDGKKVEL